MAAVTKAIERWACGSVCTSWSRTDTIMAQAPTRHSDFRDHRPLPLSEIYELYSEVVNEGRWTNGLLEMWCVGILGTILYLSLAGVEE